MADNVILPGTGEPVAADELPGGVKMQQVKLDGGSNGASTPIVAGPQTSSNSLPVVGPNDEFVTVSVDVTRPADTTAYAVNDCISDSTSAPTTFTIANAAKASGGSGIITDMVFISDNDPATPAQLEVYIFDSVVTSPNDNAAFAISDADAKKAVGVIQVVAFDNGNNQFFHAQNLAIGFTCVGSANLRCLIKAKNAYTPASGEAFTFRFKIQRQT